jgi:hypothetical protein
MEGVTTKNTPGGEKQPLERAMVPDRGDGIFGTGRIKTATGCQQGRKAKLVNSYSTDENTACYPGDHFLFIDPIGRKDC